MYIPISSIIAIALGVAALWLLYRLAKWRESRNPGAAELQLARVENEWANQDFEQWKRRQGERVWEEFQREYSSKFKRHQDPIKQVFGRESDDLRDLADHWPETEQRTKDRRAALVSRKQAETEAALIRFAPTAEQIQLAQQFRSRGLGDGDPEKIARNQWIAARAEELKAEHRRAEAEEEAAAEREEAIVHHASEWAKAMAPTTAPTAKDRQNAEDIEQPVEQVVYWRLFHQRCRELEERDPR